MTISNVHQFTASQDTDKRIGDLLRRMNLAEKIGQMCQVDFGNNALNDEMREAIRQGRIGSVINNVDVDSVNEMQRIATEESNLGIPLLVGRDVIHGFKTVMPIPLGQAASWNPELVRAAAEASALEAASTGVNWTFAPMVDVSRDARWGRIAESFGEDPMLASELGVAMIEGFQGKDLSESGAIAACAKHFAGYGAAESGRDYATTNIPENELRNVYLQPFRAAVKAGVATLMTSFSDLNGVPASGNEFLLRQILRCEWMFDGLVVSDWDSVRQLCVHGFAENHAGAAFQAATAGVDMEMAGDAYSEHLQGLVEQGRIALEIIDDAVSNILRVKLRLGLFENCFTDPEQFPPIASEKALQVAKDSALQSVVMLKNEQKTLPLNREKISSIAVIGPLADAPYEQLGTWIFDGDPDLSVSCLRGIRNLVGSEIELKFVPAMETSRSRDMSSFSEAYEAACASDAAVLFLGEESILSGEAHSRADISLPGAQAELVARVREAGKPVIAVVMAGRPLTLVNIIDQVDALLIAWHPGTMGGAAVADILFGLHSPSGKLPTTFPSHVGQIPIYYNQKNTGKPPGPDSIVHIDDIDAKAPQTSLGMTAFHLDAGYEPLYSFGFGLSYTSFSYADIQCSQTIMNMEDALTVSATVSNTGDIEAVEVVQFYVRDMVANVTRPVKELKGFRRINLKPGQSERVEFELRARDLAFYGREQTLMIEPGEFRVWIGGDSTTKLEAGFQLVTDIQTKP